MGFAVGELEHVTLRWLARRERVRERLVHLRAQLDLEEEGALGFEGGARRAHGRCTGDVTKGADR